MKKFALFFLTAIAVSCSKKTDTETSKTINKVDGTDSISVESEKDSIFNHWISYYQNNNPHFSPSSFEKTNESLITYRPSTIEAIYDEGFNKIYEPFLVYNSEKTKYIDFDSYFWYFDEKNGVSFEADQQINLMDLEKKTKQQIGFFGPSFTVENAFWKGDSIVVLLGNTYEKVPFKVKYNLESGKQTFYQSKDTLQFEKPYFKERLQQQGLKID